MKSGSSSTVTPVPRSSSASVCARRPLGQHQPDAGAQPHPALGVWFRGEPHDRGDHGRRRAQRAHPLDLLDAVLQRAHHRAVVAQPGQPSRGVLVLGVLDRQQHDVDGAVDVGGVGEHRARHHDRILVVGPDLDLIARRVPAQQHLMTGRVQQCGHRRADCAGTDERDAGTHNGQATGGFAPSTLWQSSRQAIPREIFRAAQPCRRFVTGHRCRSEGDVGRLGCPPPRPRRRDLHRPARRLRGVAGGVPRGRRAGGRAPAARRVLHRGRGRRRGPARGQRQPGDRHRRHRGQRHVADRARGERAAAVPARRGRGRGSAAEVPLPRSAARGSRPPRFGCAPR